MHSSTSSWRPSSTSSRRCSSSPAGMRRSASEANPTQAQLLRERGDLEQGRGRFCVQLPKVRPIVRSNKDEPNLSRIGMSLEQQPSTSGLVVLEADHGLKKKTPVAQFNKEEERQAERDECEIHVSYAIKPGDRIREVHAEDLTKTLKTLGTCHAEQPEEPGMDKKTMSASAMFAELNTATSETSPRVVNLAISRNLENVLRPCSVQRDSRPSSRAETPRQTESPTKPRRRAASICSISRTRPPRTPPLSIGRQSLAPHDR